MRWSALSGSFLVHMAGLVAALASVQPWIAYGQPLDGYPDSRTTDAGQNRALFHHQRTHFADAPQIYLAGGHVPRRGYGPGRSPMRSRDDPGCRRQRPLERAAAPDFPILGSQGPFARIETMPRPPAFCVLIGADGRVSALLVTAGSGDHRTDRALGRTIRGLIFHPATRAGRPVAAWHRLIVHGGSKGLSHAIVDAWRRIPGPTP